jgi:nitric oxide reductase subunit B
MTTKKLWIGFIAVMTISFAVLLYYGREIYRQAPPVPDKVMTVDGRILFTGQDIKDGQNVWQSLGGQELGTVWGHGAYQAPDWSADWLHKEAVFILNKLAMKTDSLPYEELADDRKAALQVLLQQDLRNNTYDKSTQTLTVSLFRAEAIASNSAFYSGLFTNDPALDGLRDNYSIPLNSLKDPERVRMMNAFFFWISWACVTERPGEEITYTNNWPAEKLVGNTPTGSLLLWTGFSVMMLIAGTGLMGLYYARKRDEMPEMMPEIHPLPNIAQTPSQKATIYYFWTVTALILVQVTLGVITAHYGVEGQAFYGFPLADWLPYSISRTWHVQLAIFWIATSWLATGLYYAPAISGHEPKFQKLGVNVLFGALLVIVLGSLAGQWMGVMQKLGLVENFWFGHCRILALVGCAPLGRRILRSICCSGYCIPVCKDADTESQFSNNSRFVHNHCVPGWWYTRHLSSFVFYRHSYSCNGHWGDIQRTRSGSACIDGLRSLGQPETKPEQRMD